MSGLLWALPGLPAATGAALALAGRRADRVAPGIGALAVLATAGLAAWAVAARPTVEAAWLGPLRAGLAVDGLSAVMVVTVAAVAAAVVVYAGADLGPQEARARFFGLLLVFVGAMLATVTATSLGTLLFAWEIMGATSYALIGFWWSDPARPPAANTAFLVTRVGDVGLYLAAGAAVAGLGTLELDRLAESPSPWLHVLAAGLILAAAGKSAQLPFSTWLSAAMQGPSPVSALLHSATMVAAGAYLLLRTQPLLAETGWALPLVAWLGAVTALLLGLVAVAQRDLKELLAASTCAQMGLLFLAVGAGSVAAGTAHLVAHAAFKSLLFLGAGLFLHVLGTKDLARLGGAARTLPVSGVAFSVAVLALAGVPPLSGWVTKDEVLAAARAASPALWLVGLAASAASALYAGKALAVLWAPADERGAPPHPPSTRLVAPMILLGAAVVALAVLGLPGVRVAFEELVHGPAGPAPAAWELALSGGIAVVVVALMTIAHRAGRLVPLALPGVPPPVAGLLDRWLDLDRARSALVVRPVLRLAAGLAALDDRVIDAGVRGAAGLVAAASRAADRGDRRVVDALVERLAAATLQTARAAGTADDRGVDGAVSAVAGALRRAGQAARRPQTGMLTQYYTQAVVAFAVLATALLLLR